MADTAKKQTTPGAWPWGKGKETHQEQDSGSKDPPAYSSDDKSNLTNEVKDSASDAKDVPDRTKKTAKSAKDSSTNPEITEEPSKIGDDAKDKAPDTEETAKEAQKPLSDLKGGSDGDEESGLRKPAGELKAANYDDLDDEMKAKLTPGKDFDISKFSGGKTKDATDDVKDTAEDTTKKGEDLPKEGEDAVAEGEKPLEEGKDGLKEVEPEPEEAAEGAKDGVDVPKEGEDALKKGEDIPKEGEDALKEGKDIPKEGEDALKEGEEGVEVPKEGEEALKEGEKIPKEGEEALKEGEEGVEGVPKEGEEALKEGEDIPKEGEEALKEGEEGVEVPKEGEEALAEGEKAAEGKTDIPLGLAILKGAKINKKGDVVDENGDVVGRIAEGELKDLVGKKVGEDGQIFDDNDKVIGKAEVLPEVAEEAQEKVDLSILKGAKVTKDGNVVDKEGKPVGHIVEGALKNLVGKKVGEDGQIFDDNGKVIGKAELLPEEEEAETDLSILKNGKVNKGGNVVDEDGKVVGRIVQGVLKNLVGKKCDEEGQIWNDNGKVIGKAELIPDDEREGLTKEAAPFEAFPDATVDGEGYVVFEGDRVGKVVEGDLKKLHGMKVDPDGDILDRAGNVVGKAERWEPEKEPEPEPEAPVDNSILAGKRVNKAGNLVDGSGTIFGRVIEGDVKRMIGRMANKNGEILSESGDVLGKAEIVPEGEREGQKEGPFAELEGCTVRKDGMVITPGGEVVGRLTQGDGKVLFGRPVDEDGDVVDKNGNVLGKAERYSEPEVEKKKGPMAGRRVNREGNVVDEDGNIIGKLTTGELSICAGKEIDDDGDVFDSKGTVVGHVSLLQDIKEPEGESEEDKAKREQAESDKKLAQQMAYCLQQCMDKVKPICSMISQKIEAAERQPKEELDEEQLVKDVRPLIEEGGKILQEANGIIRGLDPDGRIQANAKHKTATRDATPEEYHLADILKEMTSTVTTTIDNAKKKIEGMPHAKKELNPLWGLLSEPLFQILAAVGLLLNGVLGLVGQLLSGLGLGGLVDGLLGGLGIKNILKSLGVGGLTDSLTGQGKGKKKGGGLLGLGG